MYFSLCIGVVLVFILKGLKLASTDFNYLLDLVQYISYVVFKFPMWHLTGSIETIILALYVASTFGSTMNVQCQ